MMEVLELAEDMVSAGPIREAILWRKEGLVTIEPRGACFSNIHKRIWLISWKCARLEGAGEIFAASSRDGQIWRN